MKIGVLHGPNLNLLGQREPEVYGRETLADIDRRIQAEATRLGVEVECFQSNSEGGLIDAVQRMGRTADGFLVNAGGYTHTSVALRDALTGVGLPYVEVHLSNLAAREPFRHTSLLAGTALGAIMGFGGTSYILGLNGLVTRLRASTAGSREEG